MAEKEKATAGTAVSCDGLMLQLEKRAERTEQREESKEMEIPINQLTNHQLTNPS